MVLPLPREPAKIRANPIGLTYHFIFASARMVRAGQVREINSVDTTQQIMAARGKHLGCAVRAIDVSFVSPESPFCAAAGATALGADSRPFADKIFQVNETGRLASRRYHKARTHFKRIPSLKAALSGEAQC
jgi:hypothetical protein